MDWRPQPVRVCMCPGWRQAPPLGGFNCWACHWLRLPLGQRCGSGANTTPGAWVVPCF